MEISRDYLEKTDKLVKSARIFGMSNITSLVSKYPELVEVKKSGLDVFWESLIAVACIGTAYLKIYEIFLEKEQFEIKERLKEILKEILSKDQNIFYEMLQDFINYSRNMLDVGLEVTDTVGTWIWVKIENNPKASQKLKEIAHSQRLSKAVAIPIFTEFNNWWKKDSKIF